MLLFTNEEGCVRRRMQLDVWSFFLIVLVLASCGPRTTGPTPADVHDDVPTTCCSDSDQNIDQTVGEPVDIGNVADSPDVATMTDSVPATDLDTDASASSAVAACVGLASGATCSGICTSVGSCQGGVCAGMVEAPVFDVDLGLHPPTVPIALSRLDPTGARLYAVVSKYPPKVAATPGVAPTVGKFEVTIKRIDWHGDVPWSKQLSFDAVWVWVIISATEPVVTIVSMNATVPWQLTRIGLDGIAKPAVGVAGPTWQTSLETWRGTTSDCGPDHGYMILGRKTPNQAIVVAHQFDYAGQPLWTSDPLPLYDESQISNGQFWWLCRPEGGFYFAEGGKGITAIDGKGKVAWTQPIATVRLLDTSSGQLRLFAGYPHRIESWSASGTLTLKILLGDDPYVNTFAEGPLLGYARPGAQCADTFRIVRRDMAGGLMWVRHYSFGPGTGIDSACHATRGVPELAPSALPNGGWDLLISHPTADPKVINQHLVRTDPSGRTSCAVDNCPGTTTLTECDDGSAATCDWCDQTKGCLHEAK